MMGAMHLPYLGGLADLPKPADTERAERGRLAWHDAAVAAGLADHADAFIADPGGQALMAAVFGNSPYLSRSLERRPFLLTEWAERGPDHIVGRGPLPASMTTAKSVRKP